VEKPGGLEGYRVRRGVRLRALEGLGGLERRRLGMSRCAHDA
jgi:hypothetical protein